MDILLVDDNIDYLHLLTDALFASGYTVHIAKDGVEGCEILVREQIDLIISDIRMPRLDGLKLFSFAREMDRYKHINFIFISGFKDVYADNLRLDPQHDFFLDKTMSTEEIIRFVDKLMFGDFAAQWV